MMAITTSSSTNVKAVRGEGERRVVGGVECFIEFRQGQIACRGAVSAISAEKQGRRWGSAGGVAEKTPAAAVFWPPGGGGDCAGVTVVFSVLFLNHLSICQ